MKSKFTSSLAGWSALVLSMTLAFSTPTFAQLRPEPGGMWSAQHLSSMLDRVKATPAQRQQIEQIAQSLAPDLQALHQTQKSLMQKSMQLLAEPTIDEAAIERNRQEMSSQHDQITKRMSAASIAMAKVLTPEQRAQLAARMKNHGGHPSHQGGGAAGPGATPPPAP